MKRAFLGRRWQVSQASGAQASTRSTGQRRERWISADGYVVEADPAAAVRKEIGLPVDHVVVAQHAEVMA